MKHFFFPFYTADFIEGTVGMSCEEVGAYIRLLCYQFSNGAIPYKDNDMLRRITGSEIDLKYVINKFKNGKNKRLDNVMAKLREKSGKARSSAELRWQCERNANAMLYKDKVKAKDKDITKDISKPISKEKEKGSRHFVPPAPDDILKYCSEEKITIDAAAFIDHYQSNGWKVGGKAQMKDWKSAVRNWHRRERYFKKPDKSFDIMKWVPKEMRDKGVSQ